MEDIFKCSFCKAKFAGAIKLVPECGSSICESCYSALKYEAKESKEYICQNCKMVHCLPENGLVENAPLVKMLEMQREARPNDGKVDALMKLIDELQAKINKLKGYDVQGEIDEYCKELTRKVMEAIDAAFNHLNKLGNELLEQIDKFRRSVLDSESESSSPKRYKSSNMTTTDELTQLADDFKQFASATAFAPLYSSDVLIKSLQSSISSYQSKVENIEQRLKTETFRGRLMRFKPCQRLCEMKDLFGEISFEDLVDMKPANIVSRKSLDRLDSDAGQSLKAIRKPQELKNFSERNAIVFRVAFLPDGTFASTSTDTIKVREPLTGKTLYELGVTPRTSKKVLAMVSISENLLAANLGASINIWDLKDKALVKTLKGHGGSIFSLKMLRSGHLASISNDDSIMIWSHRRTGDELIRAMIGHGLKDNFEMGIMSNDLIVTCSTHRGNSYADNFLKVWSENESEYVKRIKLPADKASALVVLKNDQVVVGFYSGCIRVFDTQALSMVLSIDDCHRGGVYSVLESPNEYLLSGGSSQDPTVKVWDLNNGKLVQRIETDHFRAICSLSLSKDGRLLATSSHDQTAKIIQLK